MVNNLVKKVKSLVAGVGLAATMATGAGYASGCGGEEAGNAKKYVWKVGNCEVGGLSAKLNLNLVRELSIAPVEDPNNNLSRYQCALSTDLGLYVRINLSGKIRLSDNLWRPTDEPWPGHFACKKIEKNKPWYTNCFPTGTGP